MSNTNSDTFPTSEEIAKAIFMAARVTGAVDPIGIAVQVAQGRSWHGMARVRGLAFIALAHRFPGAPRFSVARCCGAGTSPKSFVSNCQQAVKGSRLRWFDIKSLNLVNDACGWPRMTWKDAGFATLCHAPPDDPPPPPPPTRWFSPEPAQEPTVEPEPVHAPPPAPKPEIDVDDEPPPLSVLGRFNTPRDGAAAAILGLSETKCRWPLGDPRADDFRFCAAPCFAGAPYCETHQTASQNKVAAPRRRMLGHSA